MVSSGEYVTLQIERGMEGNSIVISISILISESIPIDESRGVGCVGRVT